jgi:hypothetical protein
MREALNHLHSAKVALERAGTDKAGHRARAAQLVEQAISETESGINAGTAPARKGPPPSLYPGSRIPAH